MIRAARLQKPPLRPVLLLLAYCWMAIMSLSNLYTTVAISALPPSRFFVLSLPDWLSRTVLWICWLMLAAGFVLLLLRIRLRLGLVFSLLGFLFAIVLLAFDSYFPRRNGVDIVNSWDFSIGYLLAFIFAMFCAVFVFRVGMKFQDHSNEISSLI